MAVLADQKSELVEKFGANSTDTGRTEVQVAILTERINELSTHLKENKKDNHSRRGLIGLVNKRRKLLKYLSNTEIERYRTVIKELGLRR